MGSQARWTRPREIARSNPTIQRVLTPVRRARTAVTVRLQAPQYRLVRRLADQLVDPTLHVPDFGGDFAIDARSDLFRRLVLDGHYEPDTIRHALANTDTSKDCIDVGANIGLYTVAFAQRCDTRRVLAVEPATAALELLRRNLERNGIAERVVVHAGAVAAEPATGTLRHVDGKSEYSTLSNLTHASIREHAHRSHEQTIDVTTIDHLVERHGLEPGIVKIDVEGVESSVIAGAADTIATHRPVLLVEADDQMLVEAGASRVELHDQITSLGYDVFDADTLEPWRVGGSALMMLCLPAG